MSNRWFMNGVEYKIKDDIFIEVSIEPYITPKEVDWSSIQFPIIKNMPGRTFSQELN